MRFFRRSRPIDLDVDLVAKVVPRWSSMTEDSRRRLVDDAEFLLSSKHWEAAQRFALTDQIQTHIAAQAALLILGLDRGAYRGVRSIIVHPSTMHRTLVRQGPVPGVVVDGPVSLLGLAGHQAGPVVVAWDAVQTDTRLHARGCNVVFHEFAHKIDMLDGMADGTPPLYDEALRTEWVAVCTEAFERVRAGEETVLRDYAAMNPGEFFAVATEVFFSAPESLKESEPALYEVLGAFYSQDPAG